MKKRKTFRSPRIIVPACAVIREKTGKKVLSPFVNGLEYLADAGLLELFRFQKGVPRLRVHLWQGSFKGNTLPHDDYPKAGKERQYVVFQIGSSDGEGKFAFFSDAPLISRQTGIY